MAWNAARSAGPTRPSATITAQPANTARLATSTMRSRRMRRTAHSRPAVPTLIVSAGQTAGGRSVRRSSPPHLVGCPAPRRPNDRRCVGLWRAFPQRARHSRLLAGSYGARPPRGNRDLLTILDPEPPGQAEDLADGFGAAAGARSLTARGLADGHQEAARSTSSRWPHDRRR